MAFGKDFSDEKPLSMVQLCQMKVWLTYINVNNVIVCV